MQVTSYFNNIFTNQCYHSVLGTVGIHMPQELKSKLDEESMGNIAYPRVYIQIL